MHRAEVDRSYFVRIVHLLRDTNNTLHIHTRSTALRRFVSTSATHATYEESEEFVPVTLRRLSLLMYGVKLYRIPRVKSTITGYAAVYQFTIW